MNVRFEKTENDSLEEECIPCNEAFMEKLDQMIENMEIRERKKVR